MTYTIGLLTVYFLFSYDNDGILQAGDRRPLAFERTVTIQNAAHSQYTQKTCLISKEMATALFTAQTQSSRDRE